MMTRISMTVLFADAAQAQTFRVDPIATCVLGVQIRTRKSCSNQTSAWGIRIRRIEKGHYAGSKVYSSNHHCNSYNLFGHFCLGSGVITSREKHVHQLWRKPQPDHY